MRLDNKREWSIFFLLAAFTCVATFRVLSYGFWKDDWISYWGAVRLSPYFYTYWFHPGTTVLFAVLSFLFPPNTIWWQAIGIFLRVVAAFSVARLLRVFTKSQEIGLFAGMIFAVSPLGLDSVGWPSIYVVSLATSLMCESSIAWVEYLQGNTMSRKRSMLLMIAAIAVDPFRTFPLVFFIFLLHRRYKGERIRVSVSTVLGIVLIILASVYLLLPRIAEVSVYQFIDQHGISPSVYFSRFYVIGNYFATMTNIARGVIVPVPEELSTGIYNRIDARLGLLFLLLLGVWAWAWKRRRHHFWFPFLFLFLWLTLLYVPNFVSEMRLTMGATHRYVAIASVGWIGIVSLWFSCIQNRKVRYVLFGLLLAFSFWSTHERTHEWQVFRSRALLTHIWETIDGYVPWGNDLPVILFITGEHKVVPYTLRYSGLAPFVARRNMSSAQHFPYLLESSPDALPLVCNDHLRVLWGGQGEIQEKALPISSVYSFYITREGEVLNTTEQRRLEIITGARQVTCSPINV